MIAALSASMLLASSAGVAPVAADQAPIECSHCAEWNRPQDTGVSDIVDSIQGGSMPPSYYTLMPNHSAARLSKSEKAAFIRGIEATFKASPPIGGGGG